MDASELGDRLRSFRKYRNLSQVDVGKPLGKTAATISDWEKGKSRPSIDDIPRLAKVLDCDPARLAFGYVGPLNPDEEEDSAKEIAESPLRYRGRYLKKLPSNRMVADGASYPRNASAAGVLEDALDHMSKWVQAAEEDPRAAAVLEFLLKKYLPLEDIPKAAKAETET